MFKHVHWLLIVFVLLIPALVMAQDDESTEDVGDETVSDSTDLTIFGLTIPVGWQDESTDIFAHFVHDDIDVEIYVLITEESNQQAAMQLGIETVIDPDFSTEPLETVELDRANGIWTQNRYTLGTDDRLTATVQRSADDLTFVVLQRGAGEALDAAEVTHDAVLANIYITPDNNDFLALGMGAAFVLLVGFIGSLVVRHNNLKKDMALLRRLYEDDAAA